MAAQSGDFTTLPVWFGLVAAHALTARLARSTSRYFMVLRLKLGRDLTSETPLLLAITRFLLHSSDGNLL